MRGLASLKGGLVAGLCLLAAACVAPAEYTDAPGTNLDLGWDDPLPPPGVGARSVVTITN